MTSICNYSHPELQITEGLERHRAGTLFPYNPEFYELASGLYGPGSIIAWHLLLASTIAYWATGPRDECGDMAPVGMSTDLVAVVLYPLFAATDLLIQAIRLIGTEYRALAILCLRNPYADLTGLGEFSGTQLNLAEKIPPDILSLGQRAVAITGPLAVCYFFAAVCFMLWFLSDKVPWRPTAPVRLCLFGGYCYVLLVLTVLHLSLGDLEVSLGVWWFEVHRLFLTWFVLSSSLVYGAGILCGLALCLVGLWERDWGTVYRGAKCLGGFVVLTALIPTGLIWSSVLLGVQFVPDLAVTIDETDQLAALIAGSMALIYTIYSIFRDRTSRSKPGETALEETLGLMGAESTKEGRGTSGPRRDSLQRGERNV